MQGFIGSHRTMFATPKGSGVDVEIEPSQVERLSSTSTPDPVRVPSPGDTRAA